MSFCLSSKPSIWPTPVCWPIKADSSSSVFSNSFFRTLVIDFPGNTSETRILFRLIESTPNSFLGLELTVLFKEFLHSPLELFTICSSFLSDCFISVEFEASLDDVLLLAGEEAHSILALFSVLLSD